MHSSRRSAPAGPRLRFRATWLEVVDLNGRNRWYGPVEPAPGNGPAPSALRSAVLAGLRSKNPPPSQPLRRSATRPLAGVAGGVSTLAVSEARAQQAILSGPAVKISIKEEGWYRVTQPALVAAGLDPNANERSLRLFAEGREIPIRVTGNSAGRFGR